MKTWQFILICSSFTLIFVKVPNFGQLRSSVTNEEQRAFIKVNVLLDTAPRVVACQLATALPDSHLSEATVYRWYGHFKEGKRTDIEDLPRSGRTGKKTDEDTKEYIKELIMESEGMRTEDLLYETELPKTTLQRILTEIGAKKKMSKWIPHELTEVQKMARYVIAGKHLARHQTESKFLDKIIAIDETMLKSYDPKDQRQTSEWLLPSQPP